ncbi:tetratricopeptide repeat protein [Kordiimonas aestuarii]|uniref:tetratricopeptide repeat protein n=1 Tax=Kordiimonas aestuarii TaxID=1005925 RepID=UPI0021D3A89A|nr:tetratricopeptide repeat protein [Kordiimonas aestuarii]
MFKFSKTLTIAAGLAAASFTGGAHAQSVKTIYVGQDMNIERGMNALRSGDLDGAAKHLQRAARADIGNERLVPVLSNLCAVDYARGNLDAAEKACDRAIGEDKLFWRAYVNRGNIHKARGDFVAAQADYKRAVRIDDNELVQRALASLEAHKDKLLAEAK